jgi:hypothetical protein
MVKTIALFITALSCCGVLAQTPLPRGIVPIQGDVTVLYSPTFESRCTTVSSTPEVRYGNAKVGPFVTTETVTVGTFRDQYLVPKLFFAGFVEGGKVRMTMTLKADGSGFTSNEIDIQGDGLTPADKDNPKGKEVLGQLFKKALVPFTGTPLRQGATVPYGVCEFMPGDNVISQSGQFVVAGIAPIKGRETIIMKGDQTAICKVAGGSQRMQFNGWFAIDRESGLPAGSSMALSITLPQLTIHAISNQECFLTGGAEDTTQSRSRDLAAKSAEQRLIELKALFDKGLITPEQFEQKRAEIVKGL